jgi:hypothetical protein
MTRGGVVGAIMLGAAAVLAAQAPAGQGQAYTPPRTADGKPDLQGIWQARNSAYADLQDHPARLVGDKKSARLFYPAGLGVVENNEIPYQPWAAAKQKENFQKQETEDPMTLCYMAGVPRTMYLPLPFQIFQTPKYIAVISEYTHTWRNIYMDGSPHIEGIEFWMGDSRGRWEGEALVVDVRDFNDKTWFDMAGNFHSEELHVVERYTRTAADRLQYDVTIEDPKVFTRPWKISMPIYRVNPAERTSILEYECADLLEEAAGTLVPVKIPQ